jgi:hypothetical protein
MYVLIFASFLCLFGGGCATNYNLRAIKKARTYALEKFPDLSEEAVHYIRFAAPEIRQEVIMHKGGQYSHNDFAQTCIIWNIPEYEGKELVVVGFSEKRLKDWYPIRAMFRRYRYIASSGKSSTKAAKKKQKDKKKTLVLDLNKDSDKK